MRTIGFFGPFSLGSPEFRRNADPKRALGSLEHFRTGGSPMALWIRNLLIFFVIFLLGLSS